MAVCGLDKQNNVDIIAWLGPFSRSAADNSLRPEFSFCAMSHLRLNYVEFSRDRQLQFEMLIKMC